MVKSPSRARDGSDIVTVVVGTAGHIDHGKSTLVKALTGIDPDRLKEEQERGLTIDIGFARFDLPDGRTVGVVDVPGHERFVKNMVAGATGIDVVVLVVAADDGIMPQTREHLEILGLLGIEHGLVAITKIDVVDEELLALVSQDVRELLRGTFLEKAPLCPLSSLTKKGFPEFKAALAKVVSSVRPRDPTGPFRMPIQRVFTAPGHGTIVTGIPVSGSIALGDPIEIQPPALAGKVRGIQAYQRDVERARAGHSSALNVTDIDYKTVVRGMVACTPGVFTAERFLEARLQHLPKRKKPLRDRTVLRIHVGTAEVLGELVLLEQKELAPGGTALCQLRLHEPVCCAPGDRFIARLHSPLETVGGGTILGASKHRLKAGKAFVLERLGEKEAALHDPDEGLLGALDESPKPLRAELLSKAVQRAKPELDQTLAKLAQAGKVRDVSGGKGSPAWVTNVRWEQARGRVQSVFRQLHAARPLRLLVPRAEIKQAAGLDDMILEAVLKALEQEKKIVVQGKSGMRLAEHAVQLKPEEAELASWLVGLYDERAFVPPTRDEALEQVGGLADDDRDRACEVYAHLLERGDLVQVQPDMIFSRARYEDAKKRIVDTITRTGFLSSSAFKDSIGTSRKYAIPLLEHFDEVGLTVREGDGRVLRKS